MTRRLLSFVLVLMLFIPIVSETANAILVSTPSTINNVTYTYQDRVKFIDLSKITVSGGTMKIPGVSLSAGDIVVDEAHQKSIKILKVNPDGSYVAGQPTMIELFSQFDIPQQVIVPKTTDITEYAVKGISVQEYAARLAQQSGNTGSQSIMKGNVPSADMKKMYELFNQRGSKIYTYGGRYTFGSFGSDDSTVALEMNGALGVSPGIVADYSLSDGYKFGFVDAAQFIDLNVLIDAKIDEEMYCPVFGVDLEIPKLGAIHLGIYIVVDIEGNITLTVKAEEGVKATACVHGSTKWGIPTSFHLDTDLNKFFGAECDPMGSIKAGLYITPLVGLEILGIDVFNAQLRVGFYAYATITESTMNYGVDFVVNAFVTILDERANLINLHIPIIERNKTFRAEDDVIFYHSRLCTYQDRLNVAAMTKRPAGAAGTNAEPFSDKLPFANRKLEIWYYDAKNDPQGGANQTPTKTLDGWTDENGCLQVKFADAGIDVSKGDSVIIKAPGFTGQTDVLQGVTPFVSGYQGWSGLRGDFFEDTVEFETLSGFDLTGVDIPNSEISFETQKRIYYEGPVTVYATNKLTHATETATFNVNRSDLEYHPKKTGLQLTTIDTSYNVKPNYELKWQIKDSGYVFGTSEPTGAGGWETSHGITVRRVVVDQQVPMEDLKGNAIGLQHNVSLHLIAVNKNGSRPYTGTADLYAALGEVPADFKQGPYPIRDIGYAKFPAADMRYPNHFEYYRDSPFPVLLYELGNAPKLVLGGAVSSEEGTSTQASYLWRWEELKPDIPPTVTQTQAYTTQSPTGAPSTVYVQVEVPNIVYKKEPDMNIDAFTGKPITYTVLTPSAGTSCSEVYPDGTADRSVYQMRHIVSGLSVEGVPIPDPPLSPPAPVIYDEGELFLHDTNAFNIEFQLDHIKDFDQTLVNPMTEAFLKHYNQSAAVTKNTAITQPTTIRNDAALPVWAKGYIRSVVNNGIMKLDARGNFAVGKYTTRAEFCAAMVNALGLSSLDTVRQGFPFADVKADNPNLKQMQIAYQCGIIDGTTATSFSPDSLITRQDAATMLMRAFNLRNSNLVPADTTGLLGGFTDRVSIADYALEALEQSFALGFFRGTSETTLVPRNNITNEQTAKILWELKLKAEKPGLQWG